MPPSMSKHATPGQNSPAFRGAMWQAYRGSDTWASGGYQSGWNASDLSMSTSDWPSLACDDKSKKAEWPSFVPGSVWDSPDRAAFSAAADGPPQANVATPETPRANPATLAATSPKKRSGARRQRRNHLASTPFTEDPWPEADQQTEKDTWTAMASWCAQLTAQLEAGGDSQLAALVALRGLVWRFSKDKLGCRVVQLALSVAQSSLRDELVSELHGHVREAIDSPHANYVIQHVIHVAPVARAAFIAEEIAGIAAALARHRFGCRVLIRLLEHSAPATGTIRLVDEILQEAESLARHSFGHFVLQAVLEHGLPSQQHCIAVALHFLSADSDGMLVNAMNRNGSTVFETAMDYCSEEDKQSICQGLLSEPAHIVHLAKNQFGRFVLRALLAYPDEHVQVARGILEASPELQEKEKAFVFMTQ